MLIQGISKPLDYQSLALSSIIPNPKRLKDANHDPHK